MVYCLSVQSSEFLFKTLNSELETLNIFILMLNLGSAKPQWFCEFLSVLNQRWFTTRAYVEGGGSLLTCHFERRMSEKSLKTLLKINVLRDFSFRYAPFEMTCGARNSRQVTPPQRLHAPRSYLRPTVLDGTLTSFSQPHAYSNRCARAARQSLPPSPWPHRPR